MEGYHFDCSKVTVASGGDGKSVVLVAAGSFNPITHMHLRLFEKGRDHMRGLGYHVVGGFISPVSDKYSKKGLISASHRLPMCEAAAAGSKWISVDTWEARQSDYIPTLHVLEYLAQQLGEGITPLLLCGGDLVESFNAPGVWKPEHVEEILRKFGVLCLERSTADLKAVIKANHVLETYSSNIHIFKDVTNEISSTSVRDFVSRGWSVKYLVPDAVEQYILQHNLYKPT